MKGLLPCSAIRSETFRARLPGDRRSVAETRRAEVPVVERVDQLDGHTIRISPCLVSAYFTQPSPKRYVRP